MYTHVLCVKMMKQNIYLMKQWAAVSTQFL